MTGANAAAQYAALYAPTSDDLRRTLPDVVEGLSAQLRELSERPHPEACDRLSANLAGAQTTVRKLREALLREGGSHGR